MTKPGPHGEVVKDKGTDEEWKRGEPLVAVSYRELRPMEKAPLEERGFAERPFRGTNRFSVCGEPVRRFRPSRFRASPRYRAQEQRRWCLRWRFGSSRQRSPCPY